MTKTKKTGKELGEFIDKNMSQSRPMFVFKNYQELACDNVDEEEIERSLISLVEAAAGDKNKPFWIMELKRDEELCYFVVGTVPNERRIHTQFPYRA